MYKILLIESTSHGLMVEKQSYPEVIKADPVEQAKNVVTMLERGLPYSVVEEFCKMTGADMDKIIEIGLPRTQGPGGYTHSKLTIEQARHVLRMKGKARATELAEQYKVNPSTIKNIWNRKTWKHLD